MLLFPFHSRCRELPSYFGQTSHGDFRTLLQPITILQICTSEQRWEAIQAPCKSVYFSKKRRPTATVYSMHRSIDSIERSLLIGTVRVQLSLRRHSPHRHQWLPSWGSCVSLCPDARRRTETWSKSLNRIALWLLDETGKWNDWSLGQLLLNVSTRVHIAGHKFSQNAQKKLENDVFTILITPVRKIIWMNRVRKGKRKAGCFLCATRMRYYFNFDDFSAQARSDGLKGRWLIRKPVHSSLS